MNDIQKAEIETQLKAEIAKYDPEMDLRYIPRAVARIDVILAFFDHPDAEIRQYVAAGAMYAILGKADPLNPNTGLITPDQKEAILEKSAAALTILLNGHADPTEPDKYVRERCAEVLRIAASEKKTNMSKYVATLAVARDHDPCDWVREKAAEALKYHASASIARDTAGSVNTASVARTMKRNAKPPPKLEVQRPKRPELRV